MFGAGRTWAVGGLNVSFTHADSFAARSRPALFDRKPNCRMAPRRLPYTQI